MVLIVMHCFVIYCIKLKSLGEEETPANPFAKGKEVIMG